MRVGQRNDVVMEGRGGWTDLDALDRTTGTLVYGLGRSVGLKRVEDEYPSSRSATSYTDSLFVGRN